MMAVDKVLQILASLVALIGVAPSFIYLDLTTEGAILFSLIAGFISDRQRKILLHPVPATLLSLFFVLFYLSQMSLEHVVEPLANLLVLLLSVRLVTEKSGRNLLQIFILSTFILAASSLLSLSLGYLLSLILFIFLVSFGLLLTSFFATDPNLNLKKGQWLSLLRTGAILPLGSLILMLFFFTILPRTEHPLWDFLNPGAGSAAGFTDQVNPGDISNLGFSGEPAFRAEMDEIDPQDLYWRGLVLNKIEGKAWKRAQNPPSDRLIKKGQAVQQNIYTKSRNDQYLPGLDLPNTVKGIRHIQSSDAVFKTRHKLNKPVLFTVQTYPQSSLQIDKPQETSFYLQKPVLVTDRIAAIANEISKRETRQTKMSALNEFFIQQKLSYATTDLPVTENPVDTFLFESRRGYCEYFASSFALVLRLAGVPTRLVGGYLGGRYNEMGGYYLIDEDMAHVWVEALDDNDHWQRIDPSQLAINAEQAVTGLSRRNFNWSQAAADYIDNAWTRLVITYDLQKQLKLIFATGSQLRQLKPPKLQNTLWWLIGGGLSLSVLFLWKRQSKPMSNQQRLIRRYLASVSNSAGLKKLPESLGLFTLANLTQEPLCLRFAQIYGQAIYREQSLSEQQLTQLNEIIHQLSQKKIHFIPSEVHNGFSPHFRRQ